MSVCCVCLKEFDGENAPILMLEPDGTPLVLCPDCAALVEKIAGKPASPERTEAVRALAEIDVDSPMVATELSRLVAGEDAPLDENDAWEEDENGEPIAEEEAAPPPTPPLVPRASRLYLYLGLGCLAAALVLFVILKLVN